MPDREDPGTEKDAEARVKAMTREIKLLEKKLQRSESNRLQAEKMKDETDALYENVLKQVAAQKQEIEEAQERLSEAFEVISSSINYAARIQRSVLPDIALIDAVTRDHFILWEPRDRVGGDMYWANAWGDGYLIILADCTGHGVPGAFMTLIVIGALERALPEVAEGETGNLIARVHQFVQAALRQNRRGAESDDGLELGALYFEPAKPELVFVGGGLELLEVYDGAVNAIKGTKTALGYRRIPHDQRYDEIRVPKREGARLYMTTDGFTDQVGGETRRMFGKRRFRELLLAVQDRAMDGQKTALQETLHAYQGDERRRDDVSVIGLAL